MANDKVNARDNGITLTAEQVTEIYDILDALNLATVTMHKLARASQESDDAEWFATAIGEVAMVNCRRCDAVAELIGASPGFGNFEGKALTRGTQIA